MGALHGPRDYSDNNNNNNRRLVTLDYSDIDILYVWLQLAARQGFVSFFLMPVKKMPFEDDDDDIPYIIVKGSEG